MVAQREMLKSQLPDERPDIGDLEEYPHNLAELRSGFEKPTREQLSEIVRASAAIDEKECSDEGRYASDREIHAATMADLLNQATSDVLNGQSVARADGATLYIELDKVKAAMSHNLEADDLLASLGTKYSDVKMQEAALELEEDLGPLLQETQRGIGGRIPRSQASDRGFEDFSGRPTQQPHHVTHSPTPGHLPERYTSYTERLDAEEPSQGQGGPAL